MARTTPRIEPPLASRPIELGDDADLDEVEIRDLRVDDQPTVHDVRILRSRLVSVSLAGGHLPGLELRDVALDAVDAVGARFPEAGLTRVEFRDARLSGIDFGQAALRDVGFIRCRMDAASFRLAQLERVDFDECELREADFGGATLRSVGFAGTHVDRVDFSNARCERVDLRGARLGFVSGIAGLRGATIGVDQVLVLAPAVFADLGIKIADDTPP